MVIKDQRRMAGHLRPECSCHIYTAVHHLTALIVQAEGWLFLLVRKSGNKGLHLHISCCHQCAGNMAQVDRFLSLIDMESHESFRIYLIPTWISSAFLSFSGSFLPRSADRRRIPKHAFLLK